MEEDRRDVEGEAQEDEQELPAAVDNQNRLQALGGFWRRWDNFIIGIVLGIVLTLLGIYFLWQLAEYRDRSRYSIPEQQAEKPSEKQATAVLVSIPDELTKSLSESDHLGKTANGQIWVSFEALKGLLSQDLKQDLAKDMAIIMSSQAFTKDQLIEIFKGAAEFPETRAAFAQTFQEVYNRDPSLRRLVKGERGSRGPQGPPGRPTKDIQIDKAEIDASISRLKIEVKSLDQSITKLGKTLDRSIADLEDSMDRLQKQVNETKETVRLADILLDVKPIDPDK